MTYDEESNLTSMKNVCTHCDEILSEYHYTYNEMGYVVTEEVTERVSVYCGKYHGDKDHGHFWRGKGHEYCQHEWFRHDDKDTIALFEAATEATEKASSITRKKGGRWHQNPAYLYCTCHTKLVTTKTDYIYDSAWQILSATSSINGHQTEKECYSYDSAGNRTSYERYSGLHKVENIRYEYNSANQLTAMYTQEGWDWFGTEKTLYTYDADGNLIKEEVAYKRYHTEDEKEESKQEEHKNWFGNWFEGWENWDKWDEKEDQKPSYEPTYTTTTYSYDTENRLKAVREQGVLLQAMTYDGDGNLAYELDYNPDALVDGRNIYLPAHGNRAERNLYEKVADFHGWVRGDYTLTEYLNDVTKENVEVLAEYGKNYCSATIYTYGNELVSATTFNGYGYHFGCHHNGYHDIYNQYEKWHDRWHIKDRYHNSNDKFHNGSHNRPRTVEDGVATVAYMGYGYDFFRAVYGSYSNYHSGRYCGHSWKTAMSKVYYLYDGHGSVERVHGKDGSTFRLEYDTYGNLVSGLVEKWHTWHNDIFAHRTMNLYAYSGERYNVVSGLQFLRARWYDTDTGRFISEDNYLGTQAEPLSRNRYIYTHNNPVNYVDPSGHWIETVFDVLSLIDSCESFEEDPGLINGLMVGWDFTSLFFPIPASYAFKFAGNVIDGAKKLDFIADAGKLLKRVEPYVKPMLEFGESCVKYGMDVAKKLSDSIATKCDDWIKSFAKPTDTHKPLFEINLQFFAEKTTQEVAEDAAEETLEEAVEEATKEAAEEAVENATKEAGEDIAEETAENIIENGTKTNSIMDEIFEGTGAYSGRLEKVNSPDANADLLAERIGGESRVKFSNDPNGREFDVISDEYIGQAKPALNTLNKNVRDQMKATFEAAQQIGKKVYYQFEGAPHQSVIDKLYEYSERYGIEVIIDTNPLNQWRD